MSIAETALDYAAQLIAAATGVEAVSRDQISEEPTPEDVGETGLVIALATGTWSEVGYAMGAAKPYEFEHDAALEVLAIGGEPMTRRARVVKAIEDAKTAIAADTTLGGLVDYAEFVSPNPDDAERFYALAAILQLTFTAPDGLG